MSEQLPAVQERQQPTVMGVLSEKNEQTKHALLRCSAPRATLAKLLAMARTIVIEKPDLQECTPESILICRSRKSRRRALELNGRDCHLVPRRRSIKQDDGSWIKITEAQFM